MNDETVRKISMSFAYMIFIISLIIIVTYPVSAFTITNTTGNTWIKYQWDNGNNYDIYFDNSLRFANLSYNESVFTGLGENETHFIRIVDNLTQTQLGVQWTNTTAIPVEINPINKFLDLNNYLFWFMLGWIPFIIGVWRFSSLGLIAIAFWQISFVMSIALEQLNYADLLSWVFGMMIFSLSAFAAVMVWEGR